MLLKKAIFIGLTMATLSLPTLASALSLDVYNATNEDSTVRITQSGLCSGRGHMTPAHGESHTAKFKVKMLCLMHKKCDAVMYPSNNCTGNPVAHLSIDTDTLVSNVDQLLDPRYGILSHANRIDIVYAG